MNEEEFQLGIRNLSKFELVQLIDFYRDECRTAGEILKDFAENNFAQDVLHKVVCAKKYARISAFVKDYKEALKGE